MKRTPSKVAAQAINELAQELDEQRLLLEEIKDLLVRMNSDLGDHRRQTVQNHQDLEKRVLRLEGAR